MENNQSQTNLASEPKKKGSLKWKVYLALVIALLGAGAYGYYWLNQTRALRQEAVIVIQKAEKFDVLKSAVEEEQARCENFITQKQGDFGSFEYCKKFVDWATARDFDTK